MSSGRSVELLGTHRILVAVLVGIGLLLGLSFPFAVRYDEKVDRQRIGYNDAQTVVRLQKPLMDSGEPAVAFDVRSGEEVEIGEHRFTPQPGNHVVSIVDDEGLCVQVTNEDIDIRRWTYDSADGEHPYDEERGGACG